MSGSMNAPSPQPPSQGAGGPPQSPPPPAPPPQAPPGGLPPPGSQGATVAHPTPGGITIPPQVQTPELMAAIRAAFAHFGIDPQQFTAGAPAPSQNPATGAQEFSLWSALLPIAGAVGGSFIPGIGTAAGMAAGGALGGAAGGAIDHMTPAGIALQAAGGGLGGYLGGMSGGAAAGAAPAAAGAAGTAGAVGGPTAEALLAAPSSNPYGAAMPLGQSAGMSVSNIPWRGAFGAGLGATLGGTLAPQDTTPTAASAAMNKPLGPLNKNYQALRGSTSAPTPNFQGYNPYTAVTGSNPGYDFFRY